MAAICGAKDKIDMTAHFLSELISFLDGLPEPRIVMDADYRTAAPNPAVARTPSRSTGSLAVRLTTARSLTSPPPNCPARNAT